MKQARTSLGLIMMCKCPVRLIYLFAGATSNLVTPFLFIEMGILGCTGVYLRVLCGL